MEKPTEEKWSGDKADGQPEGLADYSEEGVDRTLIQWMLSLTPLERLLAVQEQVNAISANRSLLPAGRARRRWPC